MEPNSTHALVLVDRDSAGLDFLVRGRSAALLPVGNKPLVQIALEELHEVGIRSATISHDGEHRDISRFVGDGSRWGIAVDYADLATIDSAKFSALAPDKSIIAVRGDMLRPFGLLEEALRRRDQQGAADIYTALGVAVECESRSQLDSIGWQAVRNTCRLRPCLVADPAMYHGANMMALQGLVPGVRSAGRPTADDIIIGKGSRVHSAQSLAKSVVVGAHCMVERGVVLGSNVVIGDNCIIDTGAHLENCVVMAGSHVGRGVFLKDKIVASQHIYCLQRDLTLWIDDKRFLASAA